MAPKKTPIADDIMSSINAGDQELEQAIDDLRGVLQQDADGGFPAPAADDPLAAFGGDFGGSDFGGAAATTDFGAETSFGGGGDFGGGGASGSW